MAFCIEKFSTFICLEVATKRVILNPNPAYFDYIENPVTVCKVIYKLYELHLNRIKSIIKQIDYEWRLDYGEDYSSFDWFMKAILPRCVKLSTPPTRFCFMLICTLIYATVRDQFPKRKCYTFAKVASQCLIAVYERCYKHLFGPSYGDLGTYYKHLHRLLLRDGDRNTDYIFVQTDILLKGIISIGFGNFVLTDSEEKMLEDALIYMPPDSYSGSSSGTGSDNDSTTSNININLEWDEETHFEPNLLDDELMSMSSYSSPIYSSGTDSDNDMSLAGEESDCYTTSRVCSFCKGECSKLLSA